MLSRKLISFSKGLSKEFINHIETTPNLCMYKLGSHYIPDKLVFPKAECITLINCNRNGILNIFKTSIFPNLNRVNYLSTDPGDFKIYERYNDKLKWVFPNKPYEFYDFMVQTGRGTKDPQLIKDYVTNKKIIDGKNGFDISFEFDLNIPGYGIVAGDWWRSQFYEYLVRKQNTDIPTISENTLDTEFKQEMEEERLQKERVRYELDTVDFENFVD